MNANDDDVIQAGVDRHLAMADRLTPRRPPWRASIDRDVALSIVRPGPLLRGSRGRPSLGLLLTAGLVAIALAGFLAVGVGRTPTLPAATPTPVGTVNPTFDAGLLRPVIEPRLTIPVRPKSAWALVDDQPDRLGLVYLLEDVGSSGYDVGILIVEPLGVYDPIAETRLLPVPADLMGWIQAHPDLDAGPVTDRMVAGLRARSIDVTVTYPSDGPKGQTAQFIDIGPGPWNLESPSRKRIVLVQLPDRQLLIVLDARPELFDAGSGPFEDELGQIAFAVPGPSP